MADGSSDSIRNISNQVIPRYLDMSTRRMSKRMQESNADFWLQEMGFYRKHTPKDPTCLFRAVSEQVYCTQCRHIKVRKECVNFMREKKHLFEESVTVPFDHYLAQMECFTEWGGINEIRAMSLLYERDITVFNGQKQIREDITNHGFKRTLYLYYTPPKQYDIVYTLDYYHTVASCQSFIYETLYKDVFKMPNIMTIAYKMLYDRNAAFRHDRFFQKGNLDIREQLTTDLYRKVEDGHNDTDEVQSNLKGIPPIPYKAAKALNPYIYRNTDLDIYQEVKREVKNGGWNRHNNELQVGGRCLINLTELIEQDQNKSPSKFNNNNKNAQQKSKQENLCYTGYIQEMDINEESALVFIEDLGEKRSVPYAALKPFPSIKKNKQNNSTLHKKSTFADTGRRWKKMYNSSQKRKDTINIASGIMNDTNRNNIDDNNNNKSDLEISEHSIEYLKTDHCHTSEDHMESCSNHATNEMANNLPATTMLDNSQSISGMTQEMNEECKKTAIFTKHNVDNSSLNNPARSRSSNNHDGVLQNSHPRGKVLDENYPPHANDLQVNMEANQNMLFYVLPDGTSYPTCPVPVGNFRDPEQMDHLIPSRFFYNLGLEYFRINQTWNYGAISFEPPSAHYGGQSLPAQQSNNVPHYAQEEMARLVNGVQNCSLTHNETAGWIDDGKDTDIEHVVPNATCTNGAQNKQPKQGSSKNSNCKDPMYQLPEKRKQNGVTYKGNRGSRTRHSQNNRESLPHFPHWNQFAPMSTIANAHDSRIIAHVQPPQPHMDPMMMQQQQQQHGAASGACAPYAPPSSTLFPTIPYYPNEMAVTAEACCNPYYLTNGGFVPVTCLPPPPPSPLPPPPPPPPLPPSLSHHDATEQHAATSVVSPLFSPHLYPPPPEAAAYQSAPMSYPPMMFSPPQMQYSPVLQQQQQQQQQQQPPPPLPLPPPAPSNAQEHWYPMLGPPPSHYVPTQYAPSSAPMIAEPSSCNGRTVDSV